MNQPTRIFIQKHLNDDVHSLALQSDKFPDVDMPLAIRQITGKQKTKHKIPAFYHCDELLYPAKLSLEQSSSEVTAKHKLQRCEGKTLLDLTGGFGVDSFFFADNFERVIYVERQNELCELAKHNFDVLGKKNIKVVNDTAENYIKTAEHADWIYLDPARRTKTGKKAVLLSDCEPNVAELAPQLLAKSNRVMIKLSPMIDLAGLRKDLPDLIEIQLIAVENECKEVVAVLSNQPAPTVRLKTANYPNHGEIELFDFNDDDEKNATPTYTEKIQHYLYEPNAAAMKAGCFKLISERFEVDKLHANSHLYTSDKFIDTFPGRKFEVIKTYDFGKKSLKEFQQEIPAGNLAIRNFPITVNELRKKLKLADGGENYVFATTLYDGKKALINCRKV